jgi:hypothetical protein
MRSRDSVARAPPTGQAEIAEILERQRRAIELELNRAQPLGR